MRKYIHKIRNYWLQDASFSALLVIALFSIFVLPVLADGDLIDPLIPKLVLVLLFFIGIWSAENKFLVVSAFVLFALVLVFKLAEYLDPTINFYLEERIVRSLNLILFIYINFRLLFRDASFNFQRVIGAVNVYLFFALLGAFLFEIIQITYGSSITGNVLITNSENDFIHFMYFSLTCLTTLGFGDVQPINQAAKMLAVSLSSVGVLFPAVVIARLVSMAQLRRNDKE